MSVSSLDELKVSAHILADQNNQNISAIHLFLAAMNNEQAIAFMMHHGFDDLDNRVKELMMILSERDNRESAQLDIEASCTRAGFYMTEFLEKRKLEIGRFDPILALYGTSRAINDMMMDEIYHQDDTLKRLNDFADFIDKNYTPAFKPIAPKVQNIFAVQAQVPLAQQPTQQQLRSFMLGFAGLLRTHFETPESSPEDQTDFHEDPTESAHIVKPVFRDNRERELYKCLPELLAERVIAQDAAVQALTKSVRQVKAGLREKDKTQGAFIFTGPTGVGKTELARALAKILDRPFVKFDMADFMEWHSVSKFISTPPGYVGHDPRGGLLHKRIRDNPNAVLLLDEVEKAHPDIYNVLLQVMDNGSLSSSSGETVDFSNVMLIMTTNAGAADAERSGIGFGAKDFNAEAQDEALKKFFSPEFRNRLDGIIPFHHLTLDSMRKIVDKFLTDLSRNEFAARGIRADFSDAAREWMVEKGYDPAFGARPLKRVISTYLKDPLADRILFGDLESGGDITVDVAADGRSLVLEKIQNPGLTVH